MNLGTYIISQGDTVGILASVLLGSQDQTETLISLNRLRYPYISDDPIDQYAYAKGNVFLTGSYTNPITITINNINAINILQNDTVFVRDGSNYGAAIVSSVSGSTITLTSAISGTFGAGTITTIFTNQQNVSTQVLMTGNTLLYPFDSSSSSATDYSLLLKTDFMQDDNGFLLKSNNDVATISGIDNLNQSQKRRLQTRLGTLNLHPGYGNGLFDILGEAGTPYFAGLARFYAKKCAAQDPRIQSASIQDFSMQNDQTFMQIISIPIGSQDTVNQNLSIKIGGVST